MAAPAFEYVGHTLTDKDNLALDPNDLSTQALITTSQAAVNSVVNQVSTELLTAVITGEGVNLDLGNLVTGAVKAAVFAGVTDAIDTELFADTEGNILPREELSFTQNVSKEVLHASASTAIYGGDFKDNVIAAVGDAVAAPAFEYVGHTLTNTDGLNLNPNDLSTQALITTSHALVGGTIAELSGGEFSSGAVATAVGHVVGEYIGGALFEDYYSGAISKEEFRTTATAIAQAVGGATVLLTQENVSQEELNRATAMAESVVVNNSIAMYEALAAGLAGAGIAVGTVPALIAALGAGAVYALVNNGDGDIRQGIANAYNALPGNDNVAMVTSNGLEILDNTPEPTIGGGIQASMDDIKTSTGIPEYNDDGTPTIGGGITGELERPEVGGFSAETQERPVVGGVDGELRGEVVYAAEDAKNIANGHAYDKHVLRRGEFPEINTEEDFEELITDVISNPTHSGHLNNGRSFAYDESSNTLVIINPNDSDGGTAFRPSDGLDYVTRELK